MWQCSVGSGGNFAFFQGSAFPYFQARFPAWTLFTATSDWWWSVPVYLLDSFQQNLGAFLGEWRLQQTIHNLKFQVYKEGGRRSRSFYRTFRFALFAPDKLEACTRMVKPPEGCGIGFADKLLPSQCAHMQMRPRQLSLYGATGLDYSTLQIIACVVQNGIDYNDLIRDSDS